MEGLVDLRVERIAYLGEGLAQAGGKRCFVPFTAPGELVRARIREEARDYARADLVEVLEASPERVEPACPLFRACGGCSLQHLSSVAQREIKLGVLEEALIRQGGIGAHPEPAFWEGAAYGYRNRFSFIGAAGGPGLMRPGSNEALPLPACPIAVPRVEAFLGAASGGSSAASAAIPAGQRRTVFGSDAGLFVEGPDPMARAEILGKSLSFPTGGFFQSNLAAFAALLSDLLPMLEGGSLADLYGGSGAFAAFLAEKAERVVLVESDARAVAAAKANASAGARLDLAAMKAEDWIKLPGAGRGLDAMVVDPPRGGLSASVRSWIGSAGPPLLAYASCDPATFSRDLGSLIASGYGWEYLGAYDFYPQTARLECLAVLRREG